MHRIGTSAKILQDAALQWVEDDAMTSGAAIAFYTIFSLGPVMLIVLAVAGIVFGEKAAEGAIYNQIAGLVGSGGASAVETTIRSASTTHEGLIAKLIGPVTFFISATGVFTQIQTALNAILKTPAKNFSVVTLVKIRLISFALILAAGFILVVSLAVNAAIVGFGQSLFSDNKSVWTIWTGQTLASLIVISAMFALIFKTLPDEKIDWSEAIVGALVSGFLFSAGKSLIGVYLGNTTIISSYGAAGTFILILIWVYYSSLIFLFGAEVAQAWRCSKKGGKGSGETDRGERPQP